MSETALMEAPPTRAVAMVGNKGIQLTNMDELARFSAAVCKSGLAPKGLTTPEAVFVAVQLGMELGLTPMASLQNIASINGRPSIYGDAALALVRDSGLLTSYKEEMVGTKGKDDYGCTVTSGRRGFGELATTFTVGDAKQAKLWGKPGPWSEYSDRMLKFRARGFNLRDQFGDVLKGLRTVEETRDMPADEVAPDEPKFTPKPKALLEPVVENLQKLKAAPEPPKDDTRPAMTGTDLIKTIRSSIEAGSGFDESELVTYCKGQHLCGEKVTSLDEFATPKLQAILDKWEAICADVRAEVIA